MCLRRVGPLSDAVGRKRASLGCAVLIALALAATASVCFRGGNRTTNTIFFLLNLTRGAGSASHSGGKGTSARYFTSTSSRPDVVARTDNRCPFASPSTSANTSLALRTPGKDTVISSQRDVPSSPDTHPSSSTSAHRVATAASTSIGSMPAFARP